VKGLAAEVGAGRLRYLRLEHRGCAGPARNAGLVESGGEFIQFLDSDDLLHPDKFRRQVEQLRKHPEAGLSYCRTVRFRDTPDPTAPAIARTGEDAEQIAPSCFERRLWHTCSPIWRRNTCARIGPWSAARHYEDWEYDCRAGLQGVKPIRHPETLCFVRDHGQGRLSRKEISDVALIRSLQSTASVLLGLARRGGLPPAATAPLVKRLLAAARYFYLAGMPEEGLACLRQVLPHARGGLLARALAFDVLRRAVGGECAARWDERLRAFLIGGRPDRQQPE